MLPLSMKKSLKRKAKTSSKKKAMKTAIKAMKAAVKVMKAKKPKKTTAKKPKEVAEDTGSESETLPPGTPFWASPPPGYLRCVS